MPCNDGKRNNDKKEVQVQGVKLKLKAKHFTLAQ